MSKDAKFSRTAGNLLYHIGTRLKAQILGHRSSLIQYVADGRIASETQLNG
jgi:hypothetical protein